MRVIMSAYACEPQQGSEPAVGWHWAVEAVRAGHEVWVVTRSNNRAAIESVIDQGTHPGLHFEYIDLPRPFRMLKRRLGHIGLLGYYYLWQLLLSVHAVRLHRHRRFDIAHHVTFVNDTLPSGLAFLRIPFVWGPIGGSTHQLPPTIELDLSRQDRTHERVRSAIQFFLKYLDPFARFTRARSTVILTYTNEALDGLRPGERRRARSIVHIGVDENEPAPRDDAVPRRSGGLRVLTGGRLTHWKGYDLLIEGFAGLLRNRPGADARLVITGSGRYQTHLEELVRRHCLEQQVEFVGRLPTRDGVFELMRDSDVFALPTLRDGPPVVLLEAMAVGVPVLCLDLGATAELVPGDAGFKIEPRSRRYVIAEITRALELLDSDRDRAAAMGRIARARALRDHQWSRIRSELELSYRDALDRYTSSSPQ
jgi:glycosyltransferase involved in cell wall biosynthesis